MLATGTVAARRVALPSGAPMLLTPRRGGRSPVPHIHGLAAVPVRRTLGQHAPDVHTLTAEQGGKPDADDALAPRLALR